MDQRPVVAQLAVSSLSEQRRRSRVSGAMVERLYRLLLFILAPEIDMKRSDRDHLAFRQ